MPKIDSHQHFWKFDPVKDSWITSNMYVLQRDFLPEHIEPLLNHYGMDGCISIQVNQSELENDFMLKHAHENQFIKGVVGWVDLRANDVGDRLAHYFQYEKLKGFRHILQDEACRDYMLRPEFKKGINLLKNWNFTYDILVNADQLSYTNEFISVFPNQSFVIDHIAKPPIKAGQISDWKKQVQAIAKHENVYCKVSGMVTEADWSVWKKDGFKPYLDVIFEAFGSKRVMYGSDWPVCKLAATYGEVIDIAENYISSFSQNERDGFWGGNACQFYKLK